LHVRLLIPHPTERSYHWDRGKLRIEWDTFSSSKHCWLQDKDGQERISTFIGGRKKRQAVGIEERGPFFDLIGSLFQPRGVGRRIRRQSESDTGILYTGPLFQLGNTIVTRINDNGGLPFIGRCCFGV